MSMSYIFIVQHVHHQSDGGEDVRMIGAFSSEIEAQRAISQFRHAPGYASSAEGFSVDRYEMNKLNWHEGFVTD